MATSRSIGVLVLCACLSSFASAARLTVQRSDRGAIVKIDGQLFAEYLTDAKHQPAVWPIIGPTGEPLTRSFPLGPLLPGEKSDHPHHHSLWFAHEAVNGNNFWLEPKHARNASRANTIKHQRFLDLATDGSQATIATHNHWLAGEGNLVCEDHRTLVFGADDEARWIDFTIELMATKEPVTFGDIKDGSFATRVAGPLNVNSGGTLVNSAGQKNAAVWGMPAEWIDNYGPLKGQTVGLAMFSHPSNFRHPTRWHARKYGLLGANPFGERQFQKANVTQSSYTIPSGESLTLRYRVYLHRGDTQAGRVEQAYASFAADTLQLPERAPVFVDQFEDGMDRWVPSDRHEETSVWSVELNPKHGKVLRVSGKSSYQPPHRSPHSVALIKDVVVKDFELQATVQNTNPTAGGHRDLCFFWGYQDPAHFYYAHLGAVPDPHSSQIFIVNESPRAKITTNESPGIPWTEGWHKVKVIRDVESGSVEVFFDDMHKPVLVANDKTFSWGRVGVGTFDDNGNFAEVKLFGEVVSPLPPSAKLP